MILPPRAEAWDLTPARNTKIQTDPEEALILRNPGFENKIHSISPKHSYYEDAVDWGNAWLRQNGF